MDSQDKNIRDKIKDSEDFQRLSRAEDDGYPIEENFHEDAVKVSEEKLREKESDKKEKKA